MRNAYISGMARLMNSIPLLYLVLLSPGYLVFWDLYSREWYYPQMMFLSGVWSVRLLVLTLAVTPILRVINWLGHGKTLGRWLLPRRRHFGLASAIFAAVHLAHYVLHADTFSDIWIEAFDLALLTGWVSFIVFVALTVTSNARSVRRMGPWWKRLHVLVYPAIGLVLYHWYLFDFQFERLGVYLLIFAAIKALHGLVIWQRTIRTPDDIQKAAPLGRP